MKSLYVLIAAAAPFVGLAFAKSALAEPARISGPHTHENLSLYFVHGPSADGPVPLTLDEALARDAVRVIETGEVNELRVENLGKEEVFIQAGDIVKGGKQDRTIVSSLVLPPKSGEVPLAAFCVEQGRWRARGAESVAAFSSSRESMPSREAKLAMRAPKANDRRDYEARQMAADARANVDRQQMNTAALYAGESRQSKVWDSVRKTQDKLSGSMNESVAAAASDSSLQLSLENQKLAEARAKFISALDAKGTGESDIVGLVFAVNGKLNSADVYPSNGLFRKMWGKLLQAAVTEAIGEKADGAKGPVPDMAAVETFLKAAETGEKHEEEIAKLMRIETRDAPAALYVEAKAKKSGWVHRNYVAK